MTTPETTEIVIEQNSTIVEVLVEGVDREVVEVERLSAPAQVLVEQTVHEVEFSATGERGLPGAPGAQGPPGEDAKAVNYTHTQNTLSVVWTVSHNLGYKPGGVLVEDADGNEIEPTIVHMNNNVILLTFYQPTAGTAYIS